MSIFCNPMNSMDEPAQVELNTPRASRPEILSKCGSSDLGHMLMLGDGEHLLFSEAAKGQAVLKGYHA